MTSVSSNNSSQLRASDHSPIVPNSGNDPFSRKLRDSKNPPLQAPSSGVARPRSKRDTGTALQRAPDINEVHSAFREIVQDRTPLDPTDASSAVIDKFLSSHQEDMLSPLEHRELMMQLAISVAGLSRDLDWETQRYLANAMAIALIPETVLAEISEALMNPKNPFYYDGVKFRGIEGLTPDQGIDVVRNIIVDKLRTLGGFSHKAAYFLVRNLVYDLDFVTMNAPYDNIRYGKEYFTKIAGKNAAAQAEKQRRHEAWGETLLTVRADAVYNIAGSNAGIVDSLDALNRANQIHARAQMPGATEEEKERSKILLSEEANLWAKGNNDRALLNDPEACVEAYKQELHAQLTPLPELKFETRLQIAQGMAKDAYWKVQQLLDTGATSGVDKAYYKQFSDYLEQAGPRKAFASITARRKAINISSPDPTASLKPSEYNKLVTTSWLIKQDPYLRKAAPRLNLPGAFATIYKTLDGKIGAIKSDGSNYKFINADGTLINHDGSLNEFAAARELFALPAGFDGSVHRSSPRNEEGKTIKDIAESCADRVFVDLTKQFKDANYNATGFQTFLSFIPFYTMATNRANDPLSELDISDLVSDVFDVLLTLVTAGMSAVGRAGLKTIQAATKGLSGSAKAGKVLSMAAKMLLSKKGAVTFSKEIADFVLPVFTAKDIVAAGAQAGIGSKNALKRVLSGKTPRPVIGPKKPAPDFLLPLNRATEFGVVPPQFANVQKGDKIAWKGFDGNGDFIVTRLGDSDQIVALKSQGGGSYRIVDWDNGQPLANKSLVYQDPTSKHYHQGGLKGAGKSIPIPPAKFVELYGFLPNRLQIMIDRAQKGLDDLRQIKEKLTLANGQLTDLSRALQAHSEVRYRRFQQIDREIAEFQGPAMKKIEISAEENGIISNATFEIIGDMRRDRNMTNKFERTVEDLTENVDTKITEISTLRDTIRADAQQVTNLIAEYKTKRTALYAAFGVEPPPLP